MTNEQINRLVAEELGWKPYCHPADYLWSLVDRNDNLVGKSYRGGLSEDHCWAVCNLNFCDDHNAAAEMRKGIKEDERLKYVSLLFGICGADSWNLANATPRQYNEAFLRLRGKWREG